MSSIFQPLSTGIERCLHVPINKFVGRRHRRHQTCSSPVQPAQPASIGRWYHLSKIITWKTFFPVLNFTTFENEPKPAAPSSKKTPETCSSSKYLKNRNHWTGLGCAAPRKKSRTNMNKNWIKSQIIDFSYVTPSLGTNGFPSII